MAGLRVDARACSALAHAPCCSAEAQEHAGCGHPFSWTIKHGAHLVVQPPEAQDVQAGEVAIVVPQAAAEVVDAGWRTPPSAH